MRQAIIIAPFLLALSIFHSLDALSWRKRLKKRKLEHPRSLIFKTDKNEYLLGSHFLDFCEVKNKHLNEYNDSYFNTHFLQQSHQVRHFIRNFTTDCDKGIPFELDLKKYKIHGTFVDRKSKYLVIITGGFTNAHEYMASYIKLLPNYDLVFFDLPGHGLDQVEPTTTSGRLSQYIIGVNMDNVTLGSREVETIQAVTSYFKARAYYKSVIGIARCYSAPFFAQASAFWQKKHVTPLFDKLLIDSAFPSFKHMTPNFPALFCSRSNAPLLRDISQTWLVKIGFVSIAEFFLSKPFSQCPPLAPFLASLNATDMFFIHSLKDIAISLEDFNAIWNSLDGVENKAVLFTYNKHAMNHIKQKELYKHISEQFIELPFNEFVSSLVKTGT